MTYYYPVYTHWYQQVNGGEAQYIETLVRYESETVYIPDEGGGSYGGYGYTPGYGNDGMTGGGYTTEDNHPREIIVNLTGKAKCIYDKLTKISGGFKNAIKKFDGEFPVAHLKFSSKVPNNPNANASTSPPSNYLIEIKINPKKLNRADLSIARTIVHEVIHAEMFRKIMSIMDNGGDLDNMTKDEWTEKLSKGDYPGIFDYYARYGYNQQHQQMATHYRSAIVDILKVFQPGLSDQLYNDLAWVGLHNTYAWNELASNEQKRIIEAIKNFDENGSKSCN